MIHVSHKKHVSPVIEVKKFQLGVIVIHISGFRQIKNTANAVVLKDLEFFEVLFTEQIREERNIIYV